MSITDELAWAYLVELRKETLASQRVRAQVVGFKISFVSAAAGLIVANSDSVPVELLAIPAVAAILFDLLIYSYSFSIKRLGYFIRSCLEPKLRETTAWPEDEPLWEEFMLLPWARQRFSSYGNLGLTFIAVVPAAVVLALRLPPLAGVPLCAGLLLAFGYDYWVCGRAPSQFRKCEPPELRDTVKKASG